MFTLINTENTSFFIYLLWISETLRLLLPIIESHVLIFFFQKICLQLWCVNPETGMCTTHHEPGAEGSSCGHKKVQITFLKPVLNEQLLKETMSGLSVHFLFHANYVFLFATEVEQLLVTRKNELLNDKVTARCLTNVSQSLYQMLQTTEMNLPLGKQVFKNQNCINLLQVWPSVPLLVLAEIFIPPFNVLNGYFYVSLNMVAVPNLNPSFSQLVK